MPYNTRRKSLSLPSLGIHLPNASRSHRSPSAPKLPPATDDQLPPPKKVKRSHDSDSESPERPASAAITLRDDKENVENGRPATKRGTYEHTPPPSPTDGGSAPKVDTEGIDDDVVVAVIKQLEKTGNRPHLIKELAAVLITVNESVANSANPAALLSSRLSAYLKRPWSALAPCPLAKELIPVHPRKVFYYLTTCPHQPLPENSDEVFIPGVDGKQITPSVSSVDQDEEDALARERARLSPSPEVDLSSPEFEDDTMDLNGHAGPGGSGAPGASFSHHRPHHRLMHSHRAASPPLEGDEKEFTQTASSVRERTSEGKASRQASTEKSPTSSFEGSDGNMSLSGSPMEDPLSSMGEESVPDGQYGDYFARLGSRAQEQDLDEVAAAALFGTSPSPSLSSASSLSSGTSTTSDAGSEVEECTSGIETTAGLLKLKQSMAASVRGATPISISGDSAAPVSLKRTVDMLETDLSEMDIKVSGVHLGAGRYDTKKPLGKSAMLGVTMDFDMIRDSWSDLRSPETVEVDELDEIFGDF
ncbi:hypothetical protein VTN02DRAFT_5414 [Thermoascus thermophilus]